MCWNIVCNFENRPKQTCAIAQYLNSAQVPLIRIGEPLNQTARNGVDNAVVEDEAQSICSF